jgi:hypothetical protein
MVTNSYLTFSSTEVYVEDGILHHSSILFYLLYEKILTKLKIYLLFWF